MSDEVQQDGGWADRRGLAFAYVLCALNGALAGIVGSFLQIAQVAGLPLGVVIALLLLAAALIGSGYLVRSRLGPVLAAGCWLAAVVVLSLPRPEGDVVLPVRGSTYVWIFGGTLVCLASIALPYRRADGVRNRRPPG